ncbi:MAG: enoyl-CoA hydratase/isomerase family protein [Ignavibacteriae bacterium]|nr:enoyl-CoA hydratase/isomerase family protein [Ignavibacteriota bacterium]MCB9243962.1 enoyl-CoA hydratase/isomerase family protein [Ignavibacteriales bacterium]
MSEKYKSFIKSDPGFKNIIYDKTGYKATITINREEKLNCVNLETIQEMITAFKDSAWDDDIAVVVLTGAGKRAFSTGADLQEQEEYFLGNPTDYYKWMAEFIALHELMRNLGKPTIARLNGLVVGGGNELNISCDLAIAAEHAELGQVGAARGSVAAAGATQFLPLIVGDRRAREILFLCERVSAQKALEWGWINQVVPYEKLDEAVDIMAEKLFNKLPECLRYTKQQLNFWRDLSWHTTIGHARDWLSLHNVSEEVREGIKAFNNKEEIDYKKIRESKKKRS